MSMGSFNAAWQNTAPKGRNRIAQGFSPGLDGRKSALKVAPDVLVWPADGRADNVKTHASVATFRARIATPYPGLKPWAVLLRPFGVDDEYGSPRRSLRRREDDRPGSEPHS